MSDWAANVEQITVSPDRFDVLFLPQSNEGERARKSCLGRCDLLSTNCRQAHNFIGFASVYARLSKGGVRQNAVEVTARLAESKRSKSVQQCQKHFQCFDRNPPAPIRWVK